MPLLTRSRWILLIAVLSATLGCGRRSTDSQSGAVAETLVSAPSGKQGKDAPGEVAIPTISETSEWPADLSTEVPEFTFGKVERVSKTLDGTSSKFTVYLHEIEPGGADRYLELLRQGGWKVERMDLGAQGSMLNGQKGELGITLTYSDERKDGMLAVFPTSK